MVKRVPPDAPSGSVARGVAHGTTMAGALAWLTVLLLWLAAARVVRADETRSVQLLLPAQPDRAAREVAARLRGELSAAGFAVVAESSAVATTPRVAMEASAQANETMVVIFVRSSDGPSIEAWISERILGSVAHERLSVVSSEVDAPRRLAVQVAELLRGRVAESALDQRAAPAQSLESASTQAPEHPPAAQRRLLWAPSVGALLLWRPHGWQLSPMPSLAVAALTPVAVREARAWSLGAALTVAGFGREIQRRGADGWAVAQQGLALTEALSHARLAAWLAAELAAGLGIYGVGVQGHAQAPFVAHERVSFSSLLAARMALDAMLARRLSLRLSGQLMFAASRTSLRIADEQVARAGGAMLAGTLELRLWL